MCSTLLLKCLRQNTFNFFILPPCIAECRIIFPPYRSGQVGERLNSTLDANLIVTLTLELQLN